MKNMKVKTKKTITSILIFSWMILVFYFSHQASGKSSELSEGVTRAILNFFKLLNDKTLKDQLLIQLFIRKLAHYLIYTLGGIIIFLHVNLYKVKLKEKVFISWIAGTVYAITDEIHQLFIPGRSGEIRDVSIDSLGTISGIIICLIVLKILQKKDINNSKEKCLGK